MKRVEIEPKKVRKIYIDYTVAEAIHEVFEAADGDADLLTGSYDMLDFFQTINRAYLNSAVDYSDKFTTNDGNTTFRVFITNENELNLNQRKRSKNQNDS